MNYNKKLATFFPVPTIALLVLAGSAAAAPIVTTAVSGPNKPSTTTDELAFAGDVSVTDLLHGIVGTGGSWKNGNGAAAAGLNDGLNAGDYNDVGLPAALTGAAWAEDGDNVSFREFELGTGSGAGYDITSIQTIAAWQGGGLANQKYTISVRYVGGATFTTLTTVEYQPMATDEGGATKVNLTDDTGVLASGVEAVRFDVLDTISVNAGGPVFREIDVIGTVSADEDPPVVTGLIPGDNASDAAPNSDLVVTFNENVAIGSGNITIKDLDTLSQIVIPVADAQISVSGAVLMIDPSSDLAPGINYAIQIDATAIDDIAGNSFVGMPDDTTWNFTTGVPDVTAPTISSLSPSDGATTASIASNLVVTFDENIAIGTGNITIKNLDTPAQTVIAVGDAQVSLSGAVLTINPGSNLNSDTNYAVQMAVTAITDLSGNPFVGISDDTTWNFVTAATPLKIMPMGDSITVGYTNADWTGGAWEFGYRSGLYTRLTNAGYNYLFVGSSTEPESLRNPETTDPAFPPTLDLKALGQNAHNGYGGKTTSFLNSNILAWLANDEPDIILLKIGTNSQDQSGLNTLVNTITTQRPNLHLIIAEIMPKWTYQQGIVNYNTYIRETLVPLYQGQGKNVTLVDQYAPFLTNPADLTSIDQSLISNGINHPDNVGYDKMAQVWFEEIEALGFGSNNFTSWISDPVFGLDPADQDFGDDPDGDRLVNGMEAWFGTHPGQFNAGLSGFSTDGTTTTFEHPQNDDPPSDLSGFYEWSLNLSDWFTSGNGPGGGPTVSFVPNTVGTTTTVTATASDALEQLFLRVRVMQN